MYIEKIANVTSHEDSQPGLIDMLVGDTRKSYSEQFTKHIKKYYGKKVVQQLHNRDIFLAEQFGPNGVKAIELLAGKFTVNPNTIFEVDIPTFNSLPVRTRTMLSDLYTIVIHDYMEGGWFFKKEHSQNSNTLLSSGSLDSGVPVFLMCTYANSVESGNICSTFPDETKKRLAIMPVHKARPWRLDMLHALDQAEIIDEIDWSLWLNFNETDVPSHFEQSKNVTTARWKTASEHPFVIKYKNQLPKKLDIIDDFYDCLPMNLLYHGKYKWHICTETYMDKFFLTEKTVKSFIAGHVPLTVAKPGFNKFLEDYGFKFVGDYDQLGGQERIDKIVEILSTDHRDYTDIARHNYDLITDCDRVSIIIADSIQKTLFKHKK